MRAVRMSAHVVEEHLEKTSKAQKTAEDIIAVAKLEAEQIRASMDAEMIAHSNRLQNLAAREGDRFIDKESLRRNAEASVLVLNSAAAVMERLQEMTPWLEELVRTCINRIAGAVPLEDLLPAIVQQAASDFRQSQQLILKCSPRRIRQLEGLRSDYPDKFLGVKQIDPDPSLEEDEMTLIGAGGITKIHLSAQIDALNSQLEQAVRETQTS